MVLFRRGVMRVSGMVLALLLAGPLMAAQEVRVAAVCFQPYVFKAEQSQATGLLDELVSGAESGRRITAL